MEEGAVANGDVVAENQLLVPLIILEGLNYFIIF